MGAKPKAARRQGSIHIAAWRDVGPSPGTLLPAMPLAEAIETTRIHR
jgi:hypothetical protein